MRLARTLALLSTLLVLAPCSSTPSEPDGSWREVEVSAPSDQVLWKIALLAAGRMDFPLTGRLDPSSGKFVTGWRTSLQPFSGAGNRTRAEVRMEPVSQGRWRVRAHVQKQVNQALVHPLDPTRAEWEWTGDDVLQAEILLRHVVSSLDPALEIQDGSEAPGERLR